MLMTEAPKEDLTWKKRETIASGIWLAGEAILVLLGSWGGRDFRDGKSILIYIQLAVCIAYVIFSNVAMRK